MRMHKLLAAAALSTCLLASGAWAQSADERLEAVERRIQQLEERLAERDAAMMEKEQALAKLQAKVAVQEQTAADIRAKAEESGGGWTDGLEIGGAIEVVLVHNSPDEGDSTSGNDLDNVEVALAAQINEMVSSELVLVHDGDDGDDMFVDTATVTIDSGAGASLTAGKAYPPFAVFDTAFYVGTMGEDLGGIDDTILQLDLDSGMGLTGSVFTFAGDVQHKGKDRVNKVGVQANYEIDLGGMGFNGGVGWVNDVREGDGFVDLSDDARKIAGLAAHGGLSFGPLSFKGHYMTARDKFDDLFVAGSANGEEALVTLPEEAFANGIPVSGTAVGSDGNALADTDANDDITAEQEAAFSYSYAPEQAKPSTYGVEVGYALEVGDRAFDLAAGWQRSQQAFGTGMAENRTVFSIATELIEGVGIQLEYMREKAYGGMTCSAALNGPANEATHFDPDTTTQDDHIPLPSSIDFGCGGGGDSSGTVSLLLSAEF